MTITNINFNKGYEHSLKEIQDLETEKFDFFMKNGINFFCKNRDSEYEAMFQCLKKTLKHVDKSKIKKIIFSTSSLDNYTLRKSIISQLLMALNLPHVIPVGVFLSRCNNYAPALLIAQSILKSENQSIVPILNFDWMKYSSKTPQIMGSNLSILSDAVVSFMVTHEEESSGYKIIDLSLETNQILYKNDLGLINEMKYLSEGLKKMSTKILSQNNLTKRDFKAFISGNYNTIVQKNYAMILGFDIEQIRYDQSQGHFFASDQIIQLKKIQEDPKYIAKDKFFLLGTGDYYWSACILEKIN